MTRTRAAVLWAALALLAFGVLSCTKTPVRSSEWRRPVFHPGNLDTTVVWAKQLTDRDLWDFKPLEDGGVGISGADLYVGGRSGSLFRLDRRTGDELTRRRMDQEIYSTPLATGSLVYFGTSEGAFLALDRATLETVWRFDIPAEVVTQPVVEDGIVYFISQADVLTALDAATGRFLWEYREQFHGTMSIRRRAQPVVVDGVVYQGFTNGNMCALDARTGKLLWRRYLGKGSRFDDVNATAVVKDGMLYTASFDNGVHCLNAETGMLLWTNPLKSASSPVLIDDRLYLTASEQGFYALSALTGATEWYIELRQLYMKRREGALSPPQRYKRDYLVFSASGTGLYFVDFRNQRLVKRFTPGNGVASTPTVHGNIVYALSNGGWLYAVALAPKGRHY